MPVPGRGMFLLGGRGEAGAVGDIQLVELSSGYDIVVRNVGSLPRPVACATSVRLLGQAATSDADICAIMMGGTDLQSLPGPFSKGWVMKASGVDVRIKECVLEGNAPLA